MQILHSKCFPQKQTPHFQMPFQLLRPYMLHGVNMQYAVFKDTLDAATEKLDEYYKKTAASDAHILAMGKLFSCTLQHCRAK